MSRRFNQHCDSFEEVEQYYKTRALQWQHDGFTLQQVQPIDDWGAVAVYEKFGVRYFSVYVYLSHRGQGNYRKFFLDKDVIVVTTKDCEMEEVLEYMDQPFIMAAPLTASPEYKWISRVYGNRKAERSQVPLMNHIDEGLAILAEINATESAKLAYCLHPIFQEDESLVDIREIPKDIDSYSVMLAMEYRHVANDYLSKRQIQAIHDIELSSLLEVNQMLIADKIQNYKDFVLYHYGNHQRSVELYAYFHNWFERLDIEDDVAYILAKLFPGRSKANAGNIAVRLVGFQLFVVTLR